MTIKHGQAVGKTTSTYNSWAGIFQRCDNRKNPAYKNYGGRGITVCERWRESFENFFEDMGIRPEGKTIDRIDHDGNYELTNCRWATPKQQSENKRNNVIITIGNESQTLSVWCEAFGLDYKTASNRIRLGWDSVKAVTDPLCFSLKPFGYLEITIGNQTKTLNEWCSLNGINYRTAYSRVYQRGWSLEQAVTVTTGPNGSSGSKQRVLK